MRLKILLILTTLGTFVAGATDWFPIAETNNHVLNLSANAGYHFDSNVAVAGFGVTIHGFHLTIGGVGNSSLPKGEMPSGKTSASAMIQAGYQIPVVKSFRVIPVVGTAAVGKIVIDEEGMTDRKPSDPVVTRLKMKYRFDGGVHFVYNWKRLIVNAAITRYTVFGGVGVEF